MTRIDVYRDYINAISDINAELQFEFIKDCRFSPKEPDCRFYSDGYIELTAGNNTRIQEGIQSVVYSSFTPRYHAYMLASHLYYRACCKDFPLNPDNYYPKERAVLSEDRNVDYTNIF